MPRTTPALVALLTLTIFAPAARADVRALDTAEEPRRPPVRTGRIDGVVRDQTGQPLPAVSIVALGETIAAARSDRLGRFSLVLEPGEYLLRVSRTGYLSTYREAVRVESSVRVEREITMVKASPEVLRAGLPALPGSAAGQPEATPAGRSGAHAHTEAAWRLRHLRRSVLRDTGNALIFAMPEDDAHPAQSSGVGQAFNASLKLATALFGRMDFTGQVNLLTSSALDTSAGWLPETWPRRIAYFSIGSVSGTRGDWQMRGAIGGGDQRSWALVGEYQTPAAATHAMRFGVWYSAQGHMPQREDRLTAAAPVARSVAGAYGYDVWATRAFEIEYGARLDRYDYISTPELFSPRVSGRLALPARLFAVGTAAQRMIAPGADEFLPPAAPGPWAPPERTFSSLFDGAPLHAERVRHLDVGIGRRFGSGPDALHLIVRRVQQSSTEQIATLFGLDSASGIGHYYVASPGDVELRAWTFEVGQRIFNRVDARIEYAVASADWTRHPMAWLLGGSAPSVLREPRERLHDFTTVINADVPETSTRIAFAYRVSTAFSDEAGAALPITDGRFDLRVHQALPYQPIRGANLEVLVGARTLARELGRAGSFYDELLTVSPPLRLMGGIQLRF